ncbi:Methyltransferase type 11 [Anaeromyxobacter dehalogenans 2CP-1]|uniref:Methyltransferase type 11 n=1 Tax=Anaeromyxobacter dehalogenans (strain ATCC BAA-258 / DSM 21875 / 2CP-1) TaxID=455488 RepID=B8JF83_ANAD2|nr:class I SAM-dependent methyltransferase [Anaeromyxobacter dehalogenans]ACL64440.1 Methyltransferase type 11 [Anaeromyxobacter dehalogenans 2CP-1]
MRVLGGPLPRMLELVAQEVRGAGEVLEVAAGTGLVTTAIAPVVGSVVATDYAGAMVRLLRGRVQADGLGNVECIERDVYALGMPPRSFDAVVCANVLHLLPELEAALRALRAVLRPGGTLVAPTYAHDETRTSRLVSRVLGATGFPGARRFTAASLSAAISAAGFEVRRTEMIPGLIPVAFVAATAP